jgi:hypothetical protein
MKNQVFGWSLILVSVVMGLWMGIRFQKEGWLGGYGSLPRRMVRLAHVALAALGIINIEFGRTAQQLALAGRASTGAVRLAGAAFVVAGISMPACCLLIARGFRRFEVFAVPVGSLCVALLLTIGGLVR